MRSTPDLCKDRADDVQVVMDLNRYCYGGRVRFGGVTFRPGECVYADANGVTVANRPIE